MHYVFHDFAATRCQWNWPTNRSLALAPLLEQRCHESSFPVIRNLDFFVGSLVYECQWWPWRWCDWRGHLLQESWWKLALCGGQEAAFSFHLPGCWGGGAEFTVLLPMVGIEVQSSLVQALTNCSFKILTWSVGSEFLQWGYTRADTLHSFLIVVGAWLTYHDHGLFDMLAGLLSGFSCNDASPTVSCDLFVLSKLVLVYGFGLKPVSWFTANA